MFEGWHAPVCSGVVCHHLVIMNLLIVVYSDTHETLWK